MEATNKSKLYEVARRQRYLIWLILGMVILDTAAYFTVEPVRLVVALALLALAVLALICVYQLAAAMDSGVAWLWAVAMIVPIVSLICLLVLNQKATGILQAGRVHVGFMGVSKDTLNQIAQAAGAERPKT